MVSKSLAKLEGHRILLVGGTSGIGFCIAEAALEQGATVIISSSQQVKVSSKTEELKAAYPEMDERITGKVCDVSNIHNQETNIIALLDFATAEKTKKLDHIVFTAGDGLYNPPFSELTVDIIHQAQTVRLMAPFMFAKHAKAYIKDASSSSLTFTSGDGTYRPAPGWTLMPIVGSAIHGLVMSAAVHLAPMRVNCVAPGATITELWGGGKKPSEEKVRELNQTMGTRLLTGEVAIAEDVAEAYLYFMKNRNVTGTVNRSDGGKFFV